MNLQAIIAAYRQTLADAAISRNELRAVRELLRDAELDARELAILRSEVFALGKAALAQHDAGDVVDWLEEASKTILEIQRKPPNTVTTDSYFSPGDDCLHAIIGKLRRARRRVDICVFTITDDRIVDAILDAHQRGVAIRILTDNDKAYDSGSDIRRMAGEGVAIKVDMTSNHMHHKFAIIDGDVLLTGSYNWTRSAAMHNQENLLATNDEKAIAAFTGEFEKLWRAMVAY